MYKIITLKKVKIQNHEESNKFKKNSFKILIVFIVKALWYKMDGATELKHLLVRIR